MRLFNSNTFNMFCKQILNRKLFRRRYCDAEKIISFLIVRLSVFSEIVKPQSGRRLNVLTAEYTRKYQNDDCYEIGYHFKKVYIRRRNGDIICENIQRAE